MTYMDSGNDSRGAGTRPASGPAKRGVRNKPDRYQWDPLRVLGLTLGAAVAVLAPAAVRADDFVLGNWEKDGWIDWGTQSDITAPEYTFSSDTGVTLGSSSLHVDQAGWSQSLSLKLEYQPGAMAAFFSHKQLKIDVTVPASDSGGWAEIYQLWFNATGYNFIGQSPTTPVKQWGWGPTGGGAQTTTLTFDYSKLVDGNTANGEISPSAGYVEFIFATNNDGTHTSFYFDNARLTTPPARRRQPRRPDQRRRLHARRPRVRHAPDRVGQRRLQ